MILYHFTHFWNLDNAGPDAILRAGLKASDPTTEKDYPLFKGQLRPCVWFTSGPEVENSLTFDREARIEVELSPLSKKLVSWPKWLKKKAIVDKETGQWETAYDVFARLERSENGVRIELGREPTETERRAWRTWWLYFGDVPLTAIREVTYADPKRRAEAEAEAAAEGRKTSYKHSEIGDYLADE